MADEARLRVTGTVGSSLRSQPRSSSELPQAEVKDAQTVESEEEEDEDEQDEEPVLKYEKLTGSLGSIYRGGDSTSSFALGGDKMIIGTHNGNINVLSLPDLSPVRFYHAHSASVSAVSISPFSPPFPSAADLPTAQIESQSVASPTPSTPSGASPKPNKKPQIPAIPSNSIYIASASIDGHVCVSSLVDSKDVTLRNFARPIQAVALSPEYKSDRTYLSGGLAGELVLTSGGRAGASADANTKSPAAVAAGWLGSIGLGTNTGKDIVLHSGEGSISTIKWSLSGKYVVWANEQGFKIMRTNLKLDSQDSGFAWKRIAHIDRSKRKQWEEMAGVWKARAEWVNDSQLENDEDIGNGSNGSTTTRTNAKNGHEQRKGDLGQAKKPKKPERLLVGWGDMAWVVNVYAGGAGVGKHVGERTIGRADIAHQLRFDDCLISGLTLYTPSLLLILAYPNNDNAVPQTSSDAQDSPRRGRQHRQNGLPPEMRLINIFTKEELDSDTLTMSRFQALSGADYHIGRLFIPRSQTASATQRGALESLGGGIWDAGVSATRIFSSGVSAKSIPRSSLNDNMTTSSSTDGKESQMSKVNRRRGLIHSSGLKVFIHSPFDCVLALKRDLGDHLAWLEQQAMYKEAWELINERPEVVAPRDDRRDASAPSTPDRSRASLHEFLTDDRSSQRASSLVRTHDSTVEKEKRRVGELWLRQLLPADGKPESKQWAAAGQLAGKVLSSSSQWERWVWEFAQSGRFDEITPYIPRAPMQPPLPSVIYELVLDHYIKNDRPRIRELLQQWEPDLFDIRTIIAAIEEQLRISEVSAETVEGGEQGRDWSIMLDGLAGLYVADARPKDALQCYIKLQYADAAMDLIREYHLLPTVANDIAGFLQLRISVEQLKKSDIGEIEEVSSEAIRLLIDQAFQGVVRPSSVVRQLKEKGKLFRSLLFLYLKALWLGQGSQSTFGSSNEVIIGEGDDFAAEFGDRALELFAEFDRPLLMDFLRSSQLYRFEKAASVCEVRDYIPELVFILSKTGETRKALFLIIDKLEDISQAISFAKEQNDEELWDNLLEYSMDKPRFIKSLLEEVGTAIDPITLVRRIPEGLEIEGLREAISRMVRDYELQHSISEGVARVLRGEVAASMDRLRTGRNRAIRFEISASDSKVSVPRQSIRTDEETAGQDHPRPIRPVAPKAVTCASCEDGLTTDDTETLVGFACGHVYHLRCILPSKSTVRTVSASAAAALQLQDRFAADAGNGVSGRGVGAKVNHAHIIRRAIGDGCLVCARQSADAG